MYKFMENNRGAISIFLIIVLVPMLVVSSIFVDMSRLRLANAAATSAGDLTLNTALTDYDAVLKDMYGLFATSQSIDELLENLEDYYKKSIAAAGVAPADADNYVDQIMSMLKSPTGTDDLMNINLTDFQVSKPTGASLSNPAILKAQIIEFMKYRGPLDLGSSFLDALQGMKNLSKQTELVDSKNKFYAEQKSLLENLESAWRNIQAYQYASASIGFPTGSYIETQAAGMGNNAAKLGDAIRDMVKYLYYSDYLYENQCAIELDKGDDEDSGDDDKWTFKWFGETITCTPAYDEDDEVTTDNVLQCLANVLASIAAVEKYTGAGNDGKLYRLIETSPSSDVARIYMVAQFNKTGKSGYAAAVKSLLQNLVYLHSAMRYCPVDEMKNVFVKVNYDDYTVELAASGSTLYSVADSQVRAHLALDANYISMFNGLTGKLNGYYNGFISTVNSKKTPVDDSVKTARSNANSFYELIEKRRNNLTKAIEDLNTVKSKLESSTSGYNNALENWEKSANNLSDDTMGKNDKKEIEQLKSILTVDKVSSLITRLTNARNSLNDALTQIDAYKFNGTSFRSFPTGGTGYSILRNMFTSAQKASIEGVEPTGDSSYDAVINSIRESIAKGTITTSWNNNEHPDLTKDQRELYTWLYNNYYDPGMNYENLTSNGNKTKSGDDELKSSQDELKKEADKHTESEPNSSTKVNRNISDYVDYLPSTEWDALASDIQKGAVETDPDALLSSSSGAVNGLLSGVMELLDNMATSLRDDLYITDYIMNMFSYDTYEAEMTVKGGGDLSAFSSWYTAESDGSYKLKDQYSKYAVDALTFTKNSINPNMNYLYGSEVEYIIYGGNDMAGNKTAAYGTIFLIRFAFNTVYAFTDAEINNTTLAAATAIFGTPPLTPLIPAAKIAMTIGLAIAESAYDLYILKTGASVPLFKNSSTWTMKPSGAAKAAAAVVLNEVVDYAVDKGYSVLNDALKKTDEELQELIDSGTDTISDLANSAVDSTVDKFTNYANEALQQVVSLCNTANLEEMMNGNLRSDDGTYNGMKATNAKINAVMSGLDEWLASQGSSIDDTVYEVKQMAVQYLKSNGGDAIKKVFEAIEQSTNDADGSVLNQKLGEIQEALKKKVDDLSKAANSKLNELRKNAVSKIEEAAKKGAESLRSELKSQIGSVFGTSSKSATETTSVVSTLLSWSYSDYLTLFLLVSTVANEEAVLLRTADVIELNMQHMKGEYASITTTETKTTSRFFGLLKKTEEVKTTEANQKAFKLSKAYTYLTVDATMEVKPLLMTLPLVADATRNQLTGTNWYQVHYTGTLGY